MIGAAISKAAGSSSEDILYALSCSELVSHHCNEVHLTASGIPARQQEVLACLRALIPDNLSSTVVIGTRHTEAALKAFYCESL